MSRPALRLVSTRRRSREARQQVRRCRTCGRRVPATRSVPVCCDAPDVAVAGLDTPAHLAGQEASDDDA